MLKRLILCCVLLALTNAQSLSLSGPSQWAVNDCDRAVEAGLVPSRLQSSWQKPITREAFCEMSMCLLSNQGLDLSSVDTTGFIFADTNAKHVLQAAALGVVKGTKNDASGSWFSPDDLITRQEAAVMLYRLAQTKVLPNPQTAQLASHTWYDRNAPAEYMANGVERSHFYKWALDGIAFCYNTGVMVGISEDRFGPNEYYTVEQSAITLLRLRDWAEAGGKTNKAEDIILIDTDPVRQTFGYRTLDGRILYDKTISISKNEETGSLWSSVEQPSGQYMVVSSHGKKQIMNTNGQYINTVYELDNAELLSDECAWVYNHSNGYSALIALPSGEILYDKVINFYKISDDLWTVNFGEEDTIAPKCGIINNSGKMIIAPKYKYYGAIYQNCFVAMTDFRGAPMLYSTDGELLSDQCGIPDVENLYFVRGFGSYLLLENNQRKVAIYQFDGTPIFSWGQVEPSGVEFMQEGLISCRLSGTGLYDRRLFNLSGVPASKSFLEYSEGEILYGRYLMWMPEGDMIVPCLCDRSGNILRRNVQGVVSNGGNFIAWRTNDPDYDSTYLPIMWAIIADENGNELFRVADVENVTFQDGQVRVIHADGSINYYSISGVLLK